MDDDVHLPWDRGSLEQLLRKIISTGEMSKADLKSSFDLTDAPHQGELLKDLSSMANTFSHHYRNHGFLIFGAQQNAITGCAFPNNEDHLQASIDDLVKRYLGPFINTHLFIFKESGSEWGALVIPPTHNAPHVFINDIHKRYRGDVYVRSGTTTVKAQPDDFARFFRQHLEEHTYELRQSVSDLQRQVAALGTQLRKLRSAPAPSRVERLHGNSPETPPESPLPLPESTKTITERINETLAREEDSIARGLLDEVKRINQFIASDEIPWAAQVMDVDKTREALGKIEAVSMEFWTAISSLVMKDDKGAYDQALLTALGLLARVVNPPSGVSYTEIGRGLRYLPLLCSLYLIAITGTARKREKLLAKVLKLELQARSHYEESLPITYLLFLTRRAGDFFQPLHAGYPQQRWCDSVASYTKGIVERVLSTYDDVWDREEQFYRGEYLLCISPMDAVERTTNRPMVGHPSSGLYLFASEAKVIIARFLAKDREWLQKVFARPLREVLAEFDQTAPRLAENTGCWSSGFVGGAEDAAFPEKVTKP